MESTWSVAACEVFRKAGGHRVPACGNRKPPGPAAYPRFSRAHRLHQRPPARRSAALDPSSISRVSARYRRPPGLLLPSPVSSLYTLSFAIVIAAVAARFFDKIEFGDFHAPFQSLAHIVDRQRRDRRCYQRFHLDPGRPRGSSLGGNLNSILAQLRTHIHVRQCQGMTKWNQLGRALGGRYTRDSSDFKRIALRRFQPPYAGD